MPMPEALSADCGIVLRVPSGELSAARAALAAADVAIRRVYRKCGNEVVLL